MDGFLVHKDSLVLIGLIAVCSAVLVVSLLVEKANRPKYTYTFNLILEEVTPERLREFFAEPETEKK